MSRRCSVSLTDGCEPLSVSRRPRPAMKCIKPVHPAAMRFYSRLSKKCTPRRMGLPLLTVISPNEKIYTYIKPVRLFPTYMYIYVVHTRLYRTIRVSVVRADLAIFSALGASTAYRHLCIVGHCLRGGKKNKKIWSLFEH